MIIFAYMKRYLILPLLFILPAIAWAETMHVTVKNPTAEQRQELVEVNVADVYAQLGIKSGTPFIVKNAIGQEVDCQVTYDGKLLIDASVMPNGSNTFTITTGVPRHIIANNVAALEHAPGTWGAGKSWASGRLYKDRLDDIAWENDRGAYRVYGPAFQASGAVGYGPDVWVKNTPELDIDRRFRMDIDIKPTQKQLEDAGLKAEAAQLVQDNSFHVDHGTGNDCYAVGATLGCGAPAIVQGDIIYPLCWQQYEILDNGPLRFTVALTFAPTAVGKTTVTEHRIYSLDKGSNFNRVEVWYEGAKKLSVCAGFPLHSPNESTLVSGTNYIQYADPTDNPEANACQLYIACLFPYNNVRTTTMQGHAIGIADIPAGSHFIYYAGSAWSKYDVRNQREWQARINTTLDALAQPLTIELTK